MAEMRNYKVSLPGFSYMSFVDESGEEHLNRPILSEDKDGTTKFKPCRPQIRHGYLVQADSVGAAKGKFDETMGIIGTDKKHKVVDLGPVVEEQ